MALSVFPNGIPIFSDHRDLLDDVKASHINSIQRELTAVAEALGQNPQIYGDLSSATTYLQADPGSGGSLDTVTLGAAPFSAQVNQVNYGTVSDRLDAMQRGDQVHVFSFTGGGMQIPATTNINSTNPLLGVNLPNAGQDPYGLYNGSGVTIKKSGWYFVQGYLYMNLLGTQAQRDGAYAAALSINGDFMQAYDRDRLSDSGFGRNPGSIVLQPIFNGYLSAGTTIQVRIGHDSGTTHQVIRTSLRGFLVREM